MTKTEAYELTLEKIAELKKAGVSVTTRSPHLLKGGTADDLPHEKWLHITFDVTDVAHLMKVNEAANYLGMCGIGFDTGGWQDYRDWELDWSFNYTGKEDEQWRDAREEVEELLKKVKSI